MPCPNEGPLREQIPAAAPDLGHLSSVGSATSRERHVHVAVDLVDGGHHPAFTVGYERTHTAPDASSRIAPPSDERTQRIRARDLQLATDAYARRLVDHAQAANRLSVLLDIEILIASTARKARLALRELELKAPSNPTTLRYVGTAGGLACLAADVRRAGVADGITVLPLSNAGTVELLAKVTVPELHHAGFIDSDAASALIATLGGTTAG
jgi:hypothetical protein